MEKEALLRLLRDRDVALGIAEALASVPEAMRLVAEAVAKNPEAAAALLKSPELLKGLAEAAAASPEIAARLAAAVAPHIAVPLNVATRDDIRALEERMATKGDLKNLATKEDAARFATKEDVKALADQVGALSDRVGALEGRVAAVEASLQEVKASVGRVEIAVRSIQKGLRVGFEYYTAAWVERWLEERGVLCDVKVGERLKVDGLTEVDLLCEDPLVVGEATAVLNTVEEAEQELEKLLQKAQAASARLGRPLYAAVLAVEWASPEVARRLEEACRQKGVVLVVGRPPR